METDSWWWTNNRTKGNRQKLEHLNKRENFFTERMTEHGSKLPREVVESPSPEIFKSSQDAILSNIFRGLCLSNEVELDDLQ